MSSNIWGDRLKKAQLKTGLSQTQLAVRLGVPASKISDAVAGRVELTASAKLQLMDLLGFVATRETLLNLVGEVWPKAASAWTTKHNEVLAQNMEKKILWKQELIKAHSMGLSRDEVETAVSQIWSSEK